MKDRKKMLSNMKYLFGPKSVAVIGASDKTDKLGNVILRNLIENRFKGKIYPINPKYPEILGKKCYESVHAVKDSIDCAIIATPAETVPNVLMQCGKKGIKATIIISGGFSEVGNASLEDQVREVAERHSIATIGVNCLGVYNPETNLDSIFLPMYKLERPKAGGISFITQSGGIGSAIMDMAAFYGMGMAKFVSYGNASVLNEVDLLEYLEKDPATEVIIMYIEGTKDGRKLFEAMKRINRKKPIIALKAGKGAKAGEAAMSHTGNLAGNYLAWKAAFRQAKVIEAESLEELFDFVKVFNQQLPKGNRIAIITNGGGPGVLATDAAEKHGLLMPEFEEKTQLIVRSILPPYASVKNPLDLVADADVSVYERVIEACMNDKNVDFLVILALCQTPPIDDRILKVLAKASYDKRKPIVTVSVGGGYTDRFRRALESSGVPSYGYPENAVKAVKQFVTYAKYRKELKG